MVTLTWSSGCRMQDTRRPGLRTVGVTDLEGYLEVVARQRERNQKPKTTGSKRHAKETITEESLKLELDGYLYHPNLLEFTLGGLFGLLQHEFENNLIDGGRTQRDSGTILEFDLSADFLRRKKYPTSVFARRYRALEPGQFRSSIERTTTAYGAVWQYISEKMPTSLRLERREVEFDSLGSEEEDRRYENSLIRLETGYIFSEDNRFSLTFERESIKQEPFELDYDVDELVLSHRLNFGLDKQHRLESELRFFDQTGTFDLERNVWRETLRLKHSDTLRSHYQLEVVDRTQGSILGATSLKEQSYYLSAMVQHRLYQSLVSQVLGFVQAQEFDDGGNIDRYGIQAVFNYRKKNRWGLLQADYGVSLQETERSGGDRRVPVIDESHTFNDPEPIILSDPNVEISSIVITSQDGTEFFRVGRDYTVRSFANLVEIRREPTGLIDEGETVLIDYIINRIGDFTLDTVTQHFGIRQNFTFGLSPYYRLERQDQNISPSGATGTVPEDLTAQFYGMEFRRGSFTAMAEYEDHDSTVRPYEAIRLSTGYSHHFDFGATAGVHARWTDVSYRPPNEREVTFFMLDCSYRHPITKRLLVEGAVIYRNEQDTFSGDDEGFDLDLSLEWLFRDMELKVSYELGRFEDDFTRNDSSRLFVQVRRNF